MHRVRGQALLLLVALGCPSATPDAEPAHGGVLHLGGMLAYTLAWDRDGISQTPGSGTWSVRNDLGFEFEVQRAFASMYRFELLPCVWPPIEDAGWGDVALRLMQWVGSRTAQAGHSGDPPNPTRLLKWMEPFHEPQDVARAALPSAATSYCQVHYAVARADAQTDDVGDAPDLMGQTLVLRGRWRQGSEAWTDFEWISALPWGAFQALNYVPGEPSLEAEGAPVKVVVQRPLAALFKGLEPATQRAEVLGNKVVKALVEGLVVRITTPQGVWQTGP